MGWSKCSESLPDDGVLCFVYFPVADNMLTGQTRGYSAAAFRKSGNWIYSDRAETLSFTPYYWRSIPEEWLKRSCFDYSSEVI